MSSQLYSERLYWSGTRGLAKKFGREVQLTQAPVLPGLPSLRLVFIDYAREAGTAEIQEVGGPQREMTGPETLGAAELLDQLKGRP